MRVINREHCQVCYVRDHQFADKFSVTVSSFLGLTNLRRRGISILLLTITSSTSDKSFDHLRSFPRTGSHCVLYDPYCFVLALTLICCRFPDLSPFILVLAFALIVTFQRFPDYALLHRHHTKLEVNSLLLSCVQDPNGSSR